MLKTQYNEFSSNIYEIGVDESGRGPLFGRVYAAAAVLPKDDTSFDFSRLKDSKKFHSKKKITEVANYIKENAICYSISFEDENVIDSINILQATQSAMHKAVKNVMKIMKDEDRPFLLLIDGNYFNSLNVFNNITKKIDTVPCICIKGGDDEYASIAAASILAKVARDEYIELLCSEYPILSENYCIDKNKGYGSKKHLEGIRRFGITQWHRRTFGICKQYTCVNLSPS